MPKELTQNGKVDSTAAQLDLQKLLAAGMQNLYLERLSKIQEMYSAKN